MSAISGISAAYPPTSPALVASQPSGVVASQAQTADGHAAQPAVVVSLSLKATASAKAASTLPSLDFDMVDNALSWAAGANGFTDNAAHFDWKHVAAQYGSAIADRDKATVNSAAAGSASHVLSYVSGSGIPIQASVSPEAIKNGTAPGTISVGAFSFTSKGSVYAVTSGKDGTLVGTKDGQAWKTWQLTSQSSATSADAGATAALQALTSLNTQKAPAVKPPTGLNVSA